MSSIASAESAATDSTIQIATFYVENLLMGLQIQQVQEINRQLEVTAVPHAPEHVKGVINLRGDVVTVVDMRQVLGLPHNDISDSCRNVIIHHDGELVGLLVDKIADILTIECDKIDPAPPNVGNIEGKLFQGVYTTEEEIVVILDLDAALGDQTS